MTRLLFVFGTTIMFALLQACWRGGIAFVAEKSTQSNDWVYTDSLKLTLENELPTNIGRVSIAFTLSEDYPYRNFTTRFTLVSPTGKSSYLTPVTLVCTPQGERLGERDFFGEERVFEGVVADSVRLTEKGAYRLSVKHYHRDERLAGVSHVKATFEIRQ